MPPFDWPALNVLLPIKQRDKVAGVLSQSLGICRFDLTADSMQRIGSNAGEQVHDWYPKLSPDRLKLAHGARGFDWLPGSDDIIASLLATAKFELAIMRSDQAMRFLGVPGQMPSVAATDATAFAVSEERIGLLAHDLAQASAAEIIFPSTGADASPSFNSNGEQPAF